MELLYNFQNVWKLKRKYIAYCCIASSIYVWHYIMCHSN